MTLPDITLTYPNQTEYNLKDHEDSVILVVNTATGCGLNNQFSGLEELYQKYKDQDFVVLGFPSNQFKQEKATNEEMTKTCETQFGVTFPLHEITDVNGDAAHDLYKWLKTEKGGFFNKDIKWNFTKFLINRDGEVVERYAPTTEPEKLKEDIEKLL